MKNLFRMKCFPLVLLLVIGSLVWLPGCRAAQETQEEASGQWEPGVEQFTRDGITYSVARQFLDEDTVLIVVAGDQGVAISQAHLSSGTLSMTFVPHDGGEITHHEADNLPLDELYQEAKELAGLTEPDSAP